MSSGDIEPSDWFNRFFDGRRSSSNEAQGSGDFPDIFRGFDEMRREMEREFQDMFKDIETRAPKDLIREYETSEGGKVKEYGPFVYGYSMTIGPDGKPKVREFGNVKSSFSSRGFSTGRPLVSSEREPLADVTTTDKEERVVVEMPGISKEDIRINVYGTSVEVSTTGADTIYHEVIDLPEDTCIETARSTYKNGILEITFNKKQKTKPKGKQINIE